MRPFYIDLWAFMQERRRLLLLPILVIMLLLGSLIVLTQGTPVAPMSHASFLDQ